MPSGSCKRKEGEPQILPALHVEKSELYYMMMGKDGQKIQLIKGVIRGLSVNVCQNVLFLKINSSKTNFIELALHRSLNNGP